MPKFFINKEEINNENNTIEISGDNYNHLKNVLRIKAGDEILLCDGQKKDYQVRVEDIKPGIIKTIILNAEENKSEPPVKVTLFQGIPKADKMDLIIQKSVELGITTVVPVITDYTVVKIKNDAEAIKKVSRWQKIAEEAAKQCNRGIIPQVDFPISFAKALEKAASFDLKIIPYEKENALRLKDAVENKPYNSAAIFIGPEGGFSETEIKNSMLADFKPVTLGPRILRTETAGLAAIAIIMNLIGDLG